jgi:hypothetical protein
MSDGSLCWRSSSAISWPKASAVLSTCFGQCGQQFAPSWKLTIAPTVPAMCVSAGNKEVFSIPRCASLGQ